MPGPESQILTVRVCLLFHGSDPHSPPIGPRNKLAILTHLTVNHSHAHSNAPTTQFFLSFTSFLVAPKMLAGACARAPSKGRVSKL
jgi:hypothetical protein